MLTKISSLKRKLLLLSATLLLASCGCFKKPSPPVEPPVIPPPPAELMEPVQANYSLRAQQSIKEWRQKLTPSQ